MNNRTINDFNLIDSIVYEICLHLPPEDILRLMLSNKQFHILKQNKTLWERLWQEKSLKHFPHLSKISEDTSWHEHFIKSYLSENSYFWWDQKLSISDRYSSSATSQSLSAVFSEIKEGYIPQNYYYEGSLNLNQIIELKDAFGKNIIEYFREMNHQDNLNKIYNAAVLEQNHIIPHILIATLCRQPDDIIKILAKYIPTKVPYLHQWYLVDDQFIINKVLFALAKDGRNELVQFFIDKKADVNFQPDDDGATALCEAIKNGHVSVVQTLLDNNADQNIPLTKKKSLFEKGDVAIHMAARLGNVEILEILLAKNASVNATNNEQWVAWQCAAFHGHYAAYKLLKTESEKLPEMTVAQASQYSPLHFAAMGGQIELMSTLLKEGAAIDLTADHDNYHKKITPLMVAVQNVNFKAVKFLVENGADIQKVSAVGNNCLHYLFAKSEHDSKRLSEKKKIFFYLLQKGVNVDTTNNYGNTVLHIVLKNHCDMEFIRPCLEITFTNKKNSFGETMFDYAMTRQIRKILEASFLIHAFLAERERILSNPKRVEKWNSFFEQYIKERTKKIEQIENKLKKISATDNKHAKKLEKNIVKLAKQNKKLIAATEFNSSLFNNATSYKQLDKHIDTISTSKKLSKALGL